MKIALKAALCALGVVMISGCSDAPLFDEEAARAEAEARIIPKVPVETVRTLELGRLQHGYLLSAFGTAPDADDYQPELRIRYDGRPGADGFYEFDFMVRPASRDEAPQAPRQIRADYELSEQMLRIAVGVRVWSARDSVEGRF